jgi:hypothetical protein
MDLISVKKSIEDLKQIDFKNEHSYEQTIWKFLTCVQLPNYVYTIPKDTIIFRTRTHKENEDFFENISQIGITPKEYIADFGRCNRPAQSVFYASENRPTSYAELIESWTKSKGIGDGVKVTIGAWKLKKNMDVVVVTSPNKHERVSEYDKVHGDYLDAELARIEDENVRKSMQEIYKFLFDIFRKPANGDKLNYILTTAFSNISLMHPDAQTDGIYYPSVPFLFQGVNYAITESFATNNLELVSALRNEFLVTSDADGKHHFSEVGNDRAKRIDIEKDLIIWK